MSYDIGAVVGLEGEKEFKAALKDINTNLKTMGTEMKAVTSAYEKGDKSAAAMTAQNQVLNKQIDEQRGKLDLLKTKLAESAAQYGENDERTHRWQQSVNLATADLNRMERQLGDNNTAIEQGDRAQENMVASTDKLASAQDKLKTGLKAAGIAAAAVGVAFAAMANAALGNADELQRQADVTGLTAERLQELQYAGNNLGVELDTITGAQAKLTKSMFAAKDGTGAQADAFEALKISVVDSNGQLKDSKQIMSEAFTALNGVGNETERDALSMQLFGKSAMEMNPMIKAGGDELNRLTEEARNSGAVMSNEAVSGLDTFGDTMDNLKNSVMGKFGESISKLSPKFTDFANDIKKIDFEVVEKNLKIFASIAAGAVTTLLALSAALAVKDLTNFATAAKAGAVAMEEYKAATKAGAIAQGALNLAQSLSPMGWLAVAVGAAATAFVVYQAMTNDSTTTTSALRDEVKELNTELDAQTTAQNDLAAARSSSLVDVNTEINQASAYVAELDGLTGANGKVVDGYKERAAYLAEQINTLIPGAVSASTDEANAYYKITDSIDAMMFAKKKEMLLAAWEVEYQDALKNRAAALDKVREAAETQTAAQTELDRLRIESLSAVGREEDVYTTKIIEAQRVLDASKATTDEANSSLGNYSTTINGFNTAQAAQNMDQLNSAIAGFSNTVVKSTGDNRAALEQSVVDAKTNLDILVGATGKAWAGMTEVEQREAKNQVSEQKTLLDQQIVEAKRGGVQLPENFGQGVTEGSPVFSGAMNGMFENGKKTVVSAGVALVDVGYGYTLLFNQGVDAGTPGVKTAGAVMAQSAADGAASKTSGASEIGANYAKGFIGGMTTRDILNLTWNAGWKLGDTASKATAKAGEVQSPSKVMKRIGSFFAEGFGLGITDGITFARKASVKLADAITAETNNLNKQLADMEAKDRADQAEKDLAAHKKSIADKYDELGKAEKKDKQKVLDEISKLQADWDGKQVIAEKTAAKLALTEKIATLAEFKKGYDSALSSLEAKQQTMAGKLSDYGKLFESVKGTDGKDLLQLGDLQGDIDKITLYGDALGKLKDKGISDSLMGEITSMNIDDALSYTKLLLEKTPAEYDKYMKLWEEKQTAAAEVAKKFFSDEFTQLKTEFVDKVPTELSGLKTEMEGIGKNSAIGLADGFWSKKSYIISTFKTVLETALQEAKEAMEIHSPSRKWAEVGKFMAEGLGVGFAGQMDSVSRKINSSIPTNVEAQYTPRMAVADTINGIGAMSALGGQASTQTIILQTVLDGKIIAQSVFDPLKNISRQRGVSLA